MKKELDAFYHDPKWKKLRSSVLREAGYMCQRCLLEGKRSQAEHVHHIFPREKYIEYEYERWNLIALCFRCHNKMHNRFNGNLSRTGEQLMRATGMMQGITVNKKKQTILVVGLRGTGKSTYVKRHLDDESLAYDMDAIASAFRLKMPHEEYYKPARRMANDFLSGFMAKAHDYVKTVYIIRTAPTVKECQQINPDKVVFCEHEYNYREMDDRAGAQQKLAELKNFLSSSGTSFEVET